ncbi:MAG TPA: glycoside hydrolase family 30 beta sandwich domain-containing protein [Terracidiphilus sp.]|nr:glycoside hydrolase family 30 beta sandwich domain-containing protein [Terracidiphilus sp.]
MPRCMILTACFTLAAIATVGAQSISVYQTTPDLLESLRHLHSLRFSAKPELGQTAPLITVDDDQRFQEIDGFGASLTDSAAWLLAKRLTPTQTDAAFKSIFSRRDGIAINFLRQPIGSSDLAVTFYSYDDLCQQTDTACTTPAGQTDPDLAHYSLAHDQEYILPLLSKALALNPSIHVMLTPWSPPGWMKTSGSILGSNPETKQPSSLRPEFYPTLANYLVKTVLGYQAGGVPVYALSVENEPLYAPPTYSGMQMLATEQAAFFANNLGPAMAAAGLKTKVMAYDHNWDRPDYPETVLKDPKAGALAAGTAWHHYAGDPAVMTEIHDEFPQKDQWVTESSGGIWQKGNVLTDEAAELIAVTRNWAKSYVLWALATDQDHGPHVGGCGTCRGLITIDLRKPENPVKLEPDYYVLGHASKFLLPGAVRIGSDEPAGKQLKDVAFRNVDGTIVLYTLNAATASQALRIGFHGKTVATILPAGSVATFVWRP